VATITQRKRSDGTLAYTAQIRLKRGGRVVHSEAQTFDRKQAAQAWARKREAELGTPTEKRDDSPLSVVIDRYLSESQHKIGKTKAQVLRTIKADPLAALPCAEIDSAELLAFFNRLGSQPQTRGNYASHLSSIFAIARPAWGYPLQEQAIRDAMKVARRMGIIAKSKQRERLPTLAELDALMEHFGMIRARRKDSAPMQAITVFAVYSSRRLAEILRIRWADLDTGRVLVRGMKNPGDPNGIDTWCDLPPEAIAVIEAQPRTDARIFPYGTDAVGMAFTRACQFHGFDGLSFHCLRHFAATRLFEMGLSIPQVAAVTGHRSWSSLQRYTHIRRAGDRLQGWKWLEHVTAT